MTKEQKKYIRKIQKMAALLALEIGSIRITEEEPWPDFILDCIRQSRSLANVTTDILESINLQLYAEQPPARDSEPRGN